MRATAVARRLLETRPPAATITIFGRDLDAFGLHGTEQAVERNVDELDAFSAAIQAVRMQAPERIVVAVPVAPRETVEDLSMQVDEVICPLIPEWMMSIGYWYLDFSQTSDEEVINLMQRAWERELSSASQTEHRDV